MTTFTQDYSVHFNLPTTKYLHLQSTSIPFMWNVLISSKLCNQLIKDKAIIPHIIKVDRGKYIPFKFKISASGRKALFKLIVYKGKLMSTAYQLKEEIPTNLFHYSFKCTHHFTLHSTTMHFEHGPIHTNYVFLTDNPDELHTTLSRELLISAI